MEKTSFRDILANLDDALAFARSLGVRVTGSRYETYRERVADWVVRSVNRIVPDDESRDDGRDAIALVEAMEMGEVIAPFMKTVDRKRASNKMKHIFNGKVRPDEDSANDAHARNIAFEVVCASRLRRAGLQVELGDPEPDLICTFGSKRLLIPCKRPYGAPGIRTGIGKALEQISDHRRPCPEEDYGAIALSLAQIAIPRGTFLNARTPSEIKDALARALDHATKSFEHEWTGQRVDRNVVGGILLHVNCVVQGSIFSLGEQSLSIALADEITPAGNVYAKFARALERTAAG